jgi:hypothetical protein
MPIANDAPIEGQIVDSASASQAAGLADVSAPYEVGPLYELNPVDP